MPRRRRAPRQPEGPPHRDEHFSRYIHVTHLASNGSRGAQYLAPMTPEMYEWLLPRGEYQYRLLLHPDYLLEDPEGAQEEHDFYIQHFGDHVVSIDDAARRELRVVYYLTVDHAWRGWNYI